MLDTDYQMDMYRKWIENEILKLPEIMRSCDWTKKYK